MINFDIEEEAKLSRNKKMTTLAFRDYIFSVVDESNLEVFGERSSFKCAQTALATAYLLSKFGIESVYILGSVCVPKISTDLSIMSWHGFWNNDHHYWIMTKFGEIVDLSVAYLHMHPMQKSAILEMPPVWIDTNQGVPTCFKYFHSECFNVDYSQGIPVTKFLEDNDKTTALSPEQEMAEYWAALERNFMKTDKTYVSRFPCHITEGMTENDLRISTSTYLSSIPKFLEKNIEFPQWIIEREAELMAPYL